MTWLGSSPTGWESTGRPRGAERHRPEPSAPCLPQRRCRVSGVNIGIADTGTVILVTNEGNGRFVTTAPGVHIAMMGMERLVETVDEAAAVLEVLARSGTGPAALGLHHDAHRPSPAGRPRRTQRTACGHPRQRPISGSSARTWPRCLPASAAAPASTLPGVPARWGASYGSVYAGPVGAVLTPALEGPEQWADLPYASTLCGACREVCPVGIDLPGLLGVSSHHRVARRARARTSPSGAPMRRWRPAPRAWGLALAAAGQTARLVPGQGVDRVAPVVRVGLDRQPPPAPPGDPQLRQRWKERRT